MTAALRKIKIGDVRKSAQAVCEEMYYLDLAFTLTQCLAGGKQYCCDCMG